MTAKARARRARATRPRRTRAPARRRPAARREPPSKDEIREGLALEGLVGTKRAAEILGVATPNFSRYRERVEAIEIDGSAAVYFRSDIEGLKRELEAERARPER